MDDQGGPAPPTDAPAFRTTIRMKVAPDSTLDGFIFANEDDARLWLSSPHWKADEVKLERVRVGEMRRCPRCDGIGSTRAVIKVGDVTLAELLGPPAAGT